MKYNSIDQQEKQIPPTPKKIITDFIVTSLSPPRPMDHSLLSDFKIFSFEKTHFAFVPIQ